MQEIKIQRKYVCKYFPFGDTVEIDACQNPWFGDEKCHLYRAVDAGTGMVLAEIIEKEETSMGYIKLLRKLLSKYGKPRLIVTDKRKSFWNGEESKNQISLILNELDIEVISSSDPTAKPNVERSFKDSQQWFTLILFQEKIFSMQDFNQEIDRLTKIHNLRFNKYKTSNSSFMPITKEEIDKHLNLWIYRKVTNGNTVSIGGNHYIPIHKNKQILFENGVNIKILSNEELDYYVLWRWIPVELKLLEDNYSVDYRLKEWDKIAFEKRKQQSIIKTMDKKWLNWQKRKTIMWIN